jgi:hypothetical protein
MRSLTQIQASSEVLAKLVADYFAALAKHDSSDSTSLPILKM